MRGNEKGLKYFGGVAASNPDALSTKINPCNDFSHMDAAFVMNYADRNSFVLDLGSGSGSLVNKIYDKVAKVTAVEYFKEFSKFTVQADNVEIANMDIMSFSPPHQHWDVITMFGIMHYFDEREAEAVYKKYLSSLKSGGVIIVKNQFGVEADVIIDGYSEELKKEYFSAYRFLDKEIAILKKAGYTDISAHDIYPPECNRWTNTHFYAITAKAP